MPAPVISVAQMRQWEKETWKTGKTEIEVIQKVGEILARRIMEITRENDRVVIMAGKGHNGDDARAAADKIASRNVEVCEAANPQEALSRFETLTRQKPALIVDGLFGIGLNRPLDAQWRALIEAINNAGTRVIAVDVPSGLNGDTGEPQGAAIRASLTLTLGAPKQGLLKASALPYVGRLEVASKIGLVDASLEGELNWVLADDFAEYPPRREDQAHKGDFGRLAIIAGSVGFHGAAVLAARAAQRAQPGLITLYTQKETYGAVAAHLQSVMVHTYSARFKLEADYDAILIGPGLAAKNVPDSIKKLTIDLWRKSKSPMVIDASALDWLPSGASAPEGAVRIVTPHPGEAARMLKSSVADIERDRPAALRALSSRYSNCWVALKGKQTLVGRNSGEISVNSSGNPHLAQGGSGDVLGGYLAGLVAQSALRHDIAKAIRFAVWEHGASADRLQATGKSWIIEELVSELGNRSSEAPGKNACL